MKEIEQRRRMSAMRSDSARSGYGAVSPVETSGGHQKVFTRRLSTIRQLRQDLVRLSLIKYVGVHGRNPEVRLEGDQRGHAQRARARLTEVARSQGPRETAQ
jgi:hypothetical protein